MKKKENFLWALSFVVSLIFLITICVIWYKSTTSYHPDNQQLDNITDVKKFLKTHWETNHVRSFTGKPLYIPTGIYIQSLYFINPYTVQLTGYIWQRYSKKLHAGVTRDIIFPDVVDNAKTNKRLIYHEITGDIELIGWHFETNIRQNFNYDKYPLDHKSIAIRIWPYDFEVDVMLVPDFSAYDSTKKGEIFGLADSIILPGFHLRETFFDYALTNYDTNFGLLHYISQKRIPELTFNIVITRKILQGIAFHILPLSAVVILLFFLLLITTHNQLKVERFKFSTSANLGGSASLFFVLMLANIRLREQFTGSDTVYIEYFFIIAYIAITAVALNGLLFNFTNFKENSFIEYHDNLFPKLLYWPLLLGSALLITLLIV